MTALERAIAAVKASDIGYVDPRTPEAIVRAVLEAIKIEDAAPAYVLQFYIIDDHDNPMLGAAVDAWRDSIDAILKEGTKP